MDLIERQKAIDALANTKDLVDVTWTDENDNVIDSIEEKRNIIANWLEKVPPAQPEQRWIPCSERLPGDGRQVLVYAKSVHYALAKYDEMRKADGTYKMQWVTFDAWKPFYTIKDVIAWMPLPEPYRAERRTDE